MNMRLIGAPKLSDVTEDMVDARAISQHAVAPGKSAYHSNCKRSYPQRSLPNAHFFCMLCIADERLSTAQIQAKL